MGFISREVAIAVAVLAAGLVVALGVRLYASRKGAHRRTLVELNGRD